MDTSAVSLMRRQSHPHRGLLDLGERGNLLKVLKWRGRLHDDRLIAPPGTTKGANVMATS